MAEENILVVPEIPYTIKLSEPLKVPDGEVTELVFKRKPRGGDLIDFDLNHVTPVSYLRVASRILGIPPSFLNNLNTEDVSKVVYFLAPFLQ